MFGRKARSCSHRAGCKHSTLSFPPSLPSTATSGCFPISLPPTLGTAEVTGSSCPPAGMDAELCGCCCHELAISWLKEAKFRPNPLQPPEENSPVKERRNSFPGVQEGSKGTQIPALFSLILCSLQSALCS